VASTADRAGANRSGLRPNPFGLAEALVGLASGFVLATVLEGIFGALSHHAGHPSGYGSDVASLLGLWIGLVGAAVAASARSRRSAAAAEGADAARSRVARRAHGAGNRLEEVLRHLGDDYGLAIRPWPDIPLGLLVGLGSQYGLVWLLELPLVPFVPHLFTRLDQPAQNLTGDAHGSGLVVLGILVCAGSPLVEELFFRGLLLRSIAGKLAPLGPRLGPVVSVVLVGLVFGLVHFEPLEFLALAGFGMVLCLVAWRTGRLGAGIVAHATFNTAAFLSVVHSH